MTLWGNVVHLSNKQDRSEETVFEKRKEQMSITYTTYKPVLGHVLYIVRVMDSSEDL